MATLLNKSLSDFNNPKIPPSICSPIVLLFAGEEHPKAENKKWGKIISPLKMEK